MTTVAGLVYTQAFLLKGLRVCHKNIFYSIAIATQNVSVSLICNKGNFSEA